MTEVWKKIAFLVPRPGSTREEFSSYWSGVHGPTVAGSPDYARYRSRYLQNHFQGEPFGEPFAYAGMAEFWLPGDNEDEFAATATYRDTIKPDEERFIDMERTISMTAAEHVVVPGRGPVKLVVIRRSEPAAPDIATGRVPVLGAVLNEVVVGSSRLPGARPVDDPIRRIDEFWFASEPDALRAATALPTSGDWSAFVATEHLFFDNGVPVGAASSADSAG